MNWADAVTDVVRKYDVYLLLGLAALVLMLLISVIRLNVRMGRLYKRKNSVGSLGTDVLDTVEQGLAQVRSNSEVVAALNEHHNILALHQGYCIQRVGILKFNAFDDVGGEQSFALALLDANNNGVLLSSLFTRTESRTYAKAIAAGRSEQPLSKEEQVALSRAMRT